MHIVYINLKYMFTIQGMYGTVILLFGKFCFYNVILL